MTVLFDFYEAPPKDDSEGELRVYARPVLGKTVTTEHVAALIHERSSLTVGDVLAALSGLSDVMANKLRNGEQVHLKGIGYFGVTLKCQDIKTPKDMRADKVSVKSIQFRADKRLKGEVMETKMQRTRHKSHSARLSDEEVDSKVAEYFKEHQVMTRRDVQHICQVKQGLAFKHIARLLKEGKIKNIGIRRQPIYISEK